MMSKVQRSTIEKISISLAPLSSLRLICWAKMLAFRLNTSKKPSRIWKWKAGVKVLLSFFHRSPCAAKKRKIEIRGSCVIVNWLLCQQNPMINLVTRADCFRQAKDPKRVFQWAFCLHSSGCQVGSVEKRQIHFRSQFRWTNCNVNAITHLLNRLQMGTYVTSKSWADEMCTIPMEPFQSR